MIFKLSTLFLSACAAVSALPMTSTQRLTDELIQKECGPLDVLNITDFSVNPWPLVAGKNVTLWMNGTVTETINEGSYLNFKVVLAPESSAPQTLFKQKVDICTEFGFECPITPGPFTFNITETIPAKFPQNISIAVFMDGNL